MGFVHTVPKHGRVGSIFDPGGAFSRCAGQSQHPPPSDFLYGRSLDQRGGILGPHFPASAPYVECPE